MGQNIHAKSTATGFTFRVWSTGSDRYITAEMSEDGVREYDLMSRIQDAVRAHFREIDERIDRARTNGTSCMIGNMRDVEGPWDERKG